MQAPPLLNNSVPDREGQSPTQQLLTIPEGVYDPEFLRRLRDTGVSIEQKSKAEVYAIKGTAIIGVIDSKSGIARSVETPNVFGFAAAY